MGRTDFDVTTGQLQNHGYFQEIYCNTTSYSIFLHKSIATLAHCFCTICGVAINTVHSLKITLILQPVPGDVKIGLARAHGNRLGAAHERRPQRKRVVLQMRTFALFGAKNFGFFEIYGVSARTRGKGSIFRDFVRTSFMDGPLYERIQ